MNRAPAAVVLATVSLAGATGGAEPCPPRAEVAGDPAVVSRVRDALGRLGVGSGAAAAGCRAVRARVERVERGQVAVSIVDGGRSEVRVVSDAALAAVWIDSWLRDELDRSWHAPRPSGSSAPVAPLPRVAPAAAHTPSSVAPAPEHVPGSVTPASARTSSLVAPAAARTSSLVAPVAERTPSSVAAVRLSSPLSVAAERTPLSPIAERTPPSLAPVAVRFPSPPSVATARSSSSVAPVVERPPGSAPAERPPGSVVPAEPPARSVLDHGALAVGYEQAFTGDAASWTGGSAAGCVAIGRACIGARVRYAYQVTGAAGAPSDERSELAALATLSTGFALGRMAIVPELGLGAGRLAAQRNATCKPDPSPKCGPGDPGCAPLCVDGAGNPTGGMVTRAIASYQPRAAAAVRIAVPLFDRVWLDAIGSVSYVPFAHAEPFVVDPKALPQATDPALYTLPGEPTASLQVGIGLRVGVP